MERCELLHTAVQWQKEASNKNLQIRRRSVLLYYLQLEKEASCKNGIFASYTKKSNIF